jgi:hypothetical protein
MRVPGHSIKKKFEIAWKKALSKDFSLNLRDF